MDLIYIFRAFHSKAAEPTFLSSAHGAFSSIEHMLRQKISLNKFKEIEIIAGILPDHNGMKLDINHKKKNEKQTKIWRLNIMLLNNE